MPEIACWFVCVRVCVCVRGINISNGDKEHLFAHMLSGHFNTDSWGMGLKQEETAAVNQRRGTTGMCEY